MEELRVVDINHIRLDTDGHSLCIWTFPESAEKGFSAEVVLEKGCIVDARMDVVMDDAWMGWRDGFRGFLGKRNTFLNARGRVGRLAAPTQNSRWRVGAVLLLVRERRPSGCSPADTSRRNPDVECFSIGPGWGETAWAVWGRCDFLFRVRPYKVRMLSSEPVFLVTYFFGDQTLGIF